MIAYCASCGAPAAPGATFCMRCGAPLALGVAQPAPTRFKPSAARFVNLTILTLVGYIIAYLVAIHFLSLPSRALSTTTLITIFAQVTGNSIVTYWFALLSLQRMGAVRALVMVSSYMFLLSISDTFITYMLLAWNYHYPLASLLGFVVRRTFGRAGLLEIALPAGLAGIIGVCLARLAANWPAVRRLPLPATAIRDISRTFGFWLLISAAGVELTYRLIIANGYNSYQSTALVYLRLFFLALNSLLIIGVTVATYRRIRRAATTP